MSGLAVPRLVMTTEAHAARQGWHAMGWTDELTDSEVHALSRRVPFAAPLQDHTAPPWIIGRDARDVLAPGNYDDLRVAFLHKRDRLMFSVWGAVYRGDREPPWRVMTHTSLLDAQSFAAIAGHPEGLFRRDPADLASPPAAWVDHLVRQDFEEVTALEAIRVPADRRAAYEHGRRRRVADLGHALAEEMGGEDVLSDRLGLAYEGLSDLLDGRYKHLVLVDDGSNLTRRFAWYVWLTLPEIDRIDVSIHTGVADPRAVKEHISVLPRGQVERRPGWIVFDFDRLPDASHMGRGSRVWAVNSIRGGEANARMVTETRQAHLSLLREDQFSNWVLWDDWLDRAARAQSVEAAIEGLELESRRLSWGAPSPARIEVLAGSLAHAIQAESSADTGPTDVDRLVAPIEDTRADPDLRREVADGALAILEDSDEKIHHRVAGLLVARCAVRRGGPWSLDDFEAMLDRKSPAIGAALEEMGSAVTVLEAAALAFERGSLGRNQAETHVLQPVFEIHQGRAAEILDRLAPPGPDEEAGQVWALLLLARALDAGLPRQNAAERLHGLVALVPSLATSRWMGFVRKESALMAAGLAHADWANLGELVATVRPDPHVIREVFEARLADTPAIKMADWWASLLVANGYSARDLSAAAPALEAWSWVLASPNWAGSESEEDAFRAAGNALDRPETDRAKALAWHVLKVRVKTPHDMQSPEIDLVRRALVLLAKDGEIEPAHALDVAQLPAVQRGAAFPWADALLAHPRPELLGDAFAALGAGAIGHVLNERSAQSIRGALRVAWVQMLALGTEDVISSLATCGDPDAVRWLAEAITDGPPPPGALCGFETRAEAVPS